MNRVRRRLFWLTVIGWATFVPASFATAVDSPARLLMNAYGVGVVGATMLLAQCVILPTIMQAYLLGLADRHDGPDPGVPVRLQSVS
jgi:hypothetical protein